MVKSFLGNREENHLQNITFPSTNYGHSRRTSTQFFCLYIKHSFSLANSHFKKKKISIKEHLETEARIVIKTDQNGDFVLGVFFVFEGQRA